MHAKLPANLNRLYFITQTIKVMFTLEQATNAQRGVEAYLYSFFNFGAILWVVNAMPRPL